jgi:aspartate aminotransferase
MSWFDKVTPTAPIEIFALSRAFTQDPHPDKVDLGIGAYRDDDARPWVLPVVRDAEIAIANDTTRNHEYLGQLGLEAFTQAAVRLLLGDQSPALQQSRLCAVQSLSGTGALRLAADFLRDHLPTSTVYISDPSWPNHKLIFQHSG